MCSDRNDGQRIYPAADSGRPPFRYIQIERKMAGFTEEDQRTLDIWQIAEKYRCMIQDFHCSKEDGCFIRLKEGFINDFTGDRIIHVEKMQEVRKYITKSHKK